MSILNKKLIIFDFETDGLNAVLSDKDKEDGLVLYNPVQLGALAIDLRKLEIIPNSEFEVKLRPADIDDPDYINKKSVPKGIRLKTIEWHAKLHNKTIDAIIEEWKEYPPAKEGFLLFQEWVDRWNPTGLYKTQPILGGQNSKSFDLPRLIDCYNDYGITWKFDKRNHIDLMDLSFLWLTFCPSPPPNYRLDTLRDYFNIDKTNAHDAAKDVLDTGSLIIRFLNLNKIFSGKVRDFK